MTKALFINGSPRKNGNTAQLLKRAMDGAREAGAEVELVNLYDQYELQGLHVVFCL
jgi:multimeric flavodoxin WrbA